MMSSIEQKNIFQLIENITPLNNRYRDLINSGARGNEVLHLMWEVGSILNTFIKTNDTKPHSLYWQVYGKAEGIKTSYITRDFLSYCFRIYKFFKTDKEIDILFPELQRYSLFREAFPLLENQKYKLSDGEVKKIIKVLNSSNDPSKIKQYLISVKSTRIGISNTRSQRLSEVKPYAQNFTMVYNQVFSLVESNNADEIEEFVNRYGKGFLKMMSEAVAGLTQENLFVPELDLTEVELSENWKTFVSNLQKLHSGPVEVRNRFRRVVRPVKLSALADMLNAFVVENGINNYRKRKGLD